MATERANRARADLAAAGVDALLVTNESNVAYLSGYTNHEAALLVTRSGADLLVTDFRYAEQARCECADYQVRTFAKGRSGMARTVAELCLTHGVLRLGFEPDAVSYAQHEELRQELGPTLLIPTGKIIERLRYVKDAEEQEYLRYACAATDRVFVALCGFIAAGKTEKEVEWQLFSLINKEGCQSGFDPVVASGARGSLPHGAASDKKLEPGEFLTVDFGCMYRGYHADMTRTVHIGRPDDQHRQIYAMVLEAQRRALAAVRAGVCSREPDAAARDYLSRCGYGDNFGHGVGHGVGLEIHEEPYLNATGEQILLSGCFVTIEPGVYLPQWGGVRIEDTVLVTDSGCEIMFRAEKELICL